jgi:predicted phage terminase large subunit-like protein
LVFTSNQSPLKKGAFLLSWSIVYKSAINSDGSLLFAEKLSQEFLEIQKKKLGSYSFSNQYMNVIVSEEDQTFKKKWFKYYDTVPKNHLNFAFIDPAIGQKKTSDYTGIVVISTDTDGNWYVRVANRERLTPTQIVNKCFEIQEQFQCRAIGIETVAYQEALIYMLSEEVGRRRVILPIKDCKPPTDRTKEARIRGLVPRVEWSRLFLKHGMFDLETELLTFPRQAHDDIVDALAHMDAIITYPEEERIEDVRPNSPADPRYENWFRKNLQKNKAKTGENY